jgi:hypothetical protein
MIEIDEFLIENAVAQKYRILLQKEVSPFGLFSSKLFSPLTSFQNYFRRTRIFKAEKSIFALWYASLL